MQTDYENLMKRYNELICLLYCDNREVSKEMIQVIRDDMEDIQVHLGKASQIQPKLSKETIGFEVD